MTRKELIEAGDSLSAEIEEANMKESFPLKLGRSVQKYEFLVHFEGHPQVPEAPPENGAEAHARLMDAMSFVLNGEIVKEEHRGASAL